MSDLPWRIEYTVREDKVVISTIKVPCLAWYGKYETAISVDGYNWRIASGYETKEEAIEGHKKYLNMTTEEIENIKWID